LGQPHRIDLMRPQSARPAGHWDKKRE